MRIRVDFNIKAKPKHVNILMDDEFDEARIRRNAKKAINERFKEYRDACHGNYKITWTYNNG